MTKGGKFRPSLANFSGLCIFRPFRLPIRLGIISLARLDDRADDQARR